MQEHDGTGKCFFWAVDAFLPTFEGLVLWTAGYVAAIFLLAIFANILFLIQAGSFYIVIFP